MQNVVAPEDQRRGRARRVQAHACVACHEPWAVRGARHPSGAWIFVCRNCDWRRIVMPVR